ncbi:MAG: hypothetical protein C0506_14955 [Anaerolinea sp.]|nr:hypothetical protein [Anaerolinea sp.]
MTPDAVVDSGTLLESTPGVVGGKLRLKGSRLSVNFVAKFAFDGRTVEDLVESYPHVDASLFHAAIAYALANRARVEAGLAEEERYVEDLMRRFPNGIGPAEARLLYSEP